MTKISCDMARDLMPLVIEGVASEDSRAAVEAHIIGCPDCAHIFADMQAQEPAAQTSDTGFIRFCRKLEGGFRIRNIIIAVLAVIVLGIAGYFGYEEICNKIYACGAITPTSEGEAKLSIDENSNLRVSVTPLTEDGLWIPSTMFGDEFAIQERRWAEERKDVMYITPFEPEWTLGRKGVTDEQRMECTDLYWIDHELHLIRYGYKAIDEDGSTVWVEDTENVLTYIPIQEIRWGNPDDYVVLYQKGDNIPLQ